MRIVDVIMSELNSDKLKLEEEIERALNDKDLDAHTKVNTIKNLLGQVVTLEMSFVKFKSYISEEQPNPQQPNQQVAPQTNVEPNIGVGEINGNTQNNVN